MLNLDTIAAAAATVATEYESSKNAIAERNAAEAALLTALIERIRPALRALSSRIQASEGTFWPDSVSTATEETWTKLRGLCVSGDESPSYDHPRANAGSYEGAGLWLLDDGSFARVSYAGSWSRWQGAASSWEATVRPQTILDVAQKYDVDAIVEAIASALERAKGTRANPTKAATERAAKIRALTSLL